MEDIIILLREYIYGIMVLAGLFHFLIGFLLYRDVVKMRGVLETKHSSLLNFFSSVYLFFLFLVLVIFILGLFLVI